MLPSLLRLLLCLCLLVDTVGPAMAATHIAVAQPAAIADAASAQDANAHQAASDCHDVPGPAVRPGPAPDDDCLERCLDLCMQHGVAAVPAVAMLTAAGPGTPPRDFASAQIAAAHAIPILRPPIG